ncbi:uncharacterized protein LOC121934096 [Sceloporus undulatus]|uniref:uncharacterized protein LOC121934096 n=1 Tax=Sceloporus undulatus TaxID=8520 RepID=UPI001C4B868C|nr:uncharacterized protein LOC121934096 [Sceloporus undulatus]
MGPLPSQPCLALEEEGCCLELHETLLVLVVLVLVVQLGLRLASLVCQSLCCLLQRFYGVAFVNEFEKPTAAPTPMKKTHMRRPCAQWSESDVPRRRRWESSPPQPRCVHCTLEPVKLTMNVQNDHLPYKENQRVGRRPQPDYPTYHLPHHPPHCDNCGCETRYRPRTASAPAAYITRYRDVACGSSEPMLFLSSNERRNTLGVVNEIYPRTQEIYPRTQEIYPRTQEIYPRTQEIYPRTQDIYPRTQVGETQYHTMGTSPDAEYPGTNLTRSRRPTKVYIYPVHPQTPPGSRGASPDRLHRRRATLGPEEMQEYNPRERRKSREVDRQSGGVPGLSRFHNLVSEMTTGMAVQTEPPNTKQQQTWPEQMPTSDWVYQPLK